MQGVRRNVGLEKGALWLGVECQGALEKILAPHTMDPTGFEPVTSPMPWGRSTVEPRAPM